MHMASPASPKDYLEHPIETLDVGSIGTRNMLDLARAQGALPAHLAPRNATAIRWSIRRWRRIGAM